MEKEMTLGSLFDGIAGFPLAAAQNGIKTIWARTLPKVLETALKQQAQEQQQASCH